MKKTPKILLIDDDKDMCESLADVLTLEANYKVAYTTKPLKALDLVKKTSYSLIIVDYKMPDINGIDLLEKIKKIRPETIIFVLTAFISTELIKKAKEKGAEKVLSKFIWPEDILKHIREYTE